MSTQWAKSPKKQCEGVRFFVSSVLKIRCHIIKNTLLQTASSAILPLGTENSHELLPALPSLINKKKPLCSKLKEDIHPKICSEVFLKSPLFISNYKEES